MKKLLIYPYQEEMSPFCRFAHLLRDYTDVIPVAPRGFGLEGKDSSKCDGGEATGKIISSDFEGSLLQCQEVLLDMSADSNLSAEHYSKIISTALDGGKHVLLTGSLRKFLLESGQKICQDTIDIVGYSNDREENITQTKLYELPIPCISVLGAGDHCNKFDLQLGIASYFMDKGYNVTLFGTKEYSGLFGFDPLPAFLFEPGDQREKILRFNHFVYDKVKEEGADLVIVGCPGAIMPDTPLVFKEYGELAFVIGNAITADTSILSLYAGSYNEPAINYLQQICKFRLNAAVRRLNMACKTMTVDQATLDFQYTTIEHKFIEDEILPVADVGTQELYLGLAKGEMERLGASLEAELINNI